MKHFYISLFIFATVIVTGFFADYTRKKEFDILCASAEQISVQPEIRQAEIQVKSMKKRFYDKKNMLMLIRSKEHIKDIETDILLMEDAVQSGDMRTAKENSIRIQVTAGYSKRSLYSFD